MREATAQNIDKGSDTVLGYWGQNIGGSKGVTGGPEPLGKSQVAIGFLRNTGTGN